MKKVLKQTTARQTAIAQAAARQNAVKQNALKQSAVKQSVLRKTMARQMLATVLAAGVAFCGPAMAADATAVEHVDALNKVFGQHPGARAIHAKGTVLQGTFEPSAHAKSISKAAHFQQSVPVTVRFSNFPGIPDLPDNHPLASPRGLAIKFTLPDGSVTDIVSHSFNGFPTPTSNDFHDLIVALGASGPDAAKPTALDKYLAGHPIAKTFLTQQKPAPVSFATLPYYGVNTFKFINAKSEVTFGRYQFLPVAGEHLLDPKAAEKAAANYLTTEIRQRVQAAPIKFKMVVQIAELGDKLDDPSIAWPANRRIVELGTLTITRADLDPDAEKPLLFLPGALTAGIEAGDPMVKVRTDAYAVSFGRRQQ
jgi:catalase